MRSGDCQWRAGTIGVNDRRIRAEQPDAFRQDNMFVEYSRPLHHDCVPILRQRYSLRNRFLHAL
jgi:hypothetical protein